MENLIIIGLAAAVLLAAAAGAAGARPQPPQIIYVQLATPDERQGSGCLPLLLLAGAILAAVALL